MFGQNVLLFTGGIIKSFLKRPEKWKILKSSLTTMINSQFKLPFTNYKYPEQSSLKMYNNFIVSYNRKTKIPDWTLEYLNEEISGGRKGNPDYRKGIEFIEDETEPKIFRSTLNDYKGSGYDRGHVVPAGNYKDSPINCQNTFKLTNISPQIDLFNRGIWKSVEHFGRELILDHEYLLACTGPLFLPKKMGKQIAVHYDVTGENNVAVPTHFFKVYLAKEKNSEKFKLMSFVIPNIPLKSENFKSFYVPLRDIERSAGFFIFSQILDSLKLSQNNDEIFL